MPAIRSTDRFKGNSRDRTKVGPYTVGYASSSDYGLLRRVMDVQGEDDDNDDSAIHYCKSCLQAGVRQELTKRMFVIEKPKEDGKPPKMVRVNIPDANRWRQCPRCGDIVPIYNLKHESKIADFVEPVNNPFDSNLGKMQGINLRNKSRLGKSKSIYKRKKEQIDSIKDDDIKRELAGGENQLASYSES